MMQALYDNMHYYMYSIANSSALNGYDADTPVTVDVKEWWQTMLEAFTGVFAVLGIGGAGCGNAYCMCWVNAKRAMRLQRRRKMKGLKIKKPGIGFYLLAASMLFTVIGFCYFFFLLRCVRLCIQPHGNSPHRACAVVYDSVARQRAL